MTTKKIMLIGISFVLASMLLSSGNALNPSFAQTNTLSQGNNDNEGNNDDNQANTVGQGNNDGGNNNSDRQNYDDFQNCLENETGTTGFATEQQIRDCFAPIYIGGSDNNDNTDNNDNN